MTLITEAYIRKEIKEKRLFPGENFVTEKANILTPSAKSYLREHKIAVVWAQEIIQVEPVIPNECTHLQLELEHLANLFYFPLVSDDTFSETEWKFFDEQRRWITQFQQHEPLPQSDFPVIRQDTRVYRYSISEIHYQLRKINLYLTGERKQNWEYYMTQLAEVFGFE